MIDQMDLVAVLQRYRGNAVVVPVERSSVAWPQVSTLPNRDVAPSAMGHASSFALGLSLAQPGTRVILLDGDGSLEMNLGALVTIGNKKPGNLYHFVSENGMYATTGGQPIPGKDVVSFSGMARAAGYVAAYEFDDLEDFASQAQRILNETGPILICVKTKPNPRLRGQRGQEMRAGRRTTNATIPQLRREFSGA
ncbi:MAG: thiamine pyrophosphate-binding protein [SAR202 cluster bacterium]|nr:thiamine pyrophosphate-binding protein [SAR202 cluster bacterium]